MNPDFSSILKVAGAAFLLAMSPVTQAQALAAGTSPAIGPISIPAARLGEKEVLTPARIGSVPAGNDFNNPDSEYCFKRSKSSDNFVMFWAKEYGDDPMANSVPGRRFKVAEALAAADLSYNYFVKQLKWAPKPGALATKYKFLIIVTGGEDGTAYGGSADNKVGVFWTPATRIAKGPYGVIAHEIGHSFQSLSRADGAPSFAGGGSISEMTSQFMLWQVYPEWQTFENYHLNDFMKATHLAFLHPDNQYHSCYPLEYWSFRHGQEIIGKMWREVEKGEDAVMTYKRLTGIDQVRFNDEMFDACRRFVTWDLPRIEKVSARYADQHFTSIKKATDNWYQISPEKCPENYGYNAIKLKVPAADTVVKVAFKGMAGEEGFGQVQLDKAGWRYGFLAHKEDGSRVYSRIFSKSEAVADFKVPAKTRFLWLVVMGAPTEHWIRASTRGQDSKSAVAEQWPYKFKLLGSEPDASVIHP